MNAPLAPSGKLTCRDFLDLVLDYVEGDVNADVKALCERHLEICRACRDYLASYRTTYRLELATLADEREELPEDLLRTILEAAGAASPQN